MVGYRVYKVAKDFDISSEALVNLLKEIGRPVNGHMSTIEADTVELISKKLAQEKASVRRKDEIKKKKFAAAKKKTDSAGGRKEVLRVKAVGKRQELEARAWREDGVPKARGKKKKKKKKKQVSQKIIA